MPEIEFAAPELLALLALVPLAALVYLAAQQARAARESAFAAPATLPSAVPRRPRWRRHLAPLAYAVALTALVVALARPEVTVAVSKESATVVLVTDQSRSMEAADVAPDRLTAARESALAFLDRLPADARAGVVTYDDAVRRVEAPGADRAAATDALRSLTAQGGTATGDALETALGLIEAGPERQAADGAAPGAIVLLSDGIARHGRDPLEVAREARDAGVPVYTIALGTDAGTVEVARPNGTTRTIAVPPDRDTLAEIARLTGGRSLETADADELAAIYDELATTVTTEDERREVSSAFAGGAALLLLLGGLGSLRWFGRLP
ncbi:MAG: VWA domain-containing protein [Solirubrobacterales bacterium]|nr:VWA domain-containing protein [Solirubrobacterales bacterium]